MSLLEKINLFLNEKKQLSQSQLEKLAKEVLRIYTDDKVDGDIESYVEDTATAYNIDAEDFYEVVIKVAKKTGIRI